MLRKLIITVIATVVMMCFLETYTWAICDQGDLHGTWSVIVGDTDDLGQQCWGNCSLTISAEGAIEEGSVYEDCCFERSEITGGQLTLLFNCVIEGTIETSNGTLYFDFGSIVGEKIILRKYSD